MFKGNKETVKAATTDSKNTYIASEIEIDGNFKGKGSIRIEGTVNGNLSITSVVIGEKGTVNGTINAKNVIVNGTLNGSIFCDSLEIMANGKISDEIKVKQLHVSGRAMGSIESKEEIIIDGTGAVDATPMKSKKIVINGSFRGNITASQLLEVGSTGSVEGQITVKNIKTEPGGKLLGSIHNYVEEDLQTNPKKAEEKITA
jgi:cytoskeletal protein CcmA (bactofilin family)